LTSLIYIRYLTLNIINHFYLKGGINSERLYDFLQENITSKYKNKLIIMDNASSHRNQKIKDLVNKDNEILYSVPYQHFTNAIENWFSVLKSKLQKKEGLTYNHLQSNIAIVLRDITFKNIFKGVYERPEKYKPKNKTRKIKKTIYKVGLLNFQRFNIYIRNGREKTHDKPQHKGLHLMRLGLLVCNRVCTWQLPFRH